jgi:DNA-binding transcriptional LysR family regulator
MTIDAGSVDRADGAGSAPAEAATPGAMPIPTTRLTVALARMAAVDRSSQSRRHIENGLCESDTIHAVNISAVDLNLLVVFEALMTERSVTRAAAKIGLSQPAFSNALARLRARLGDRLFVRGRRTMLPTPRAVELAPAIEAGLAHLRSAIEPAPFHPRRSRTAFRMATTDDVELALLPAAAARLHAEAPGVSISCSRLAGVFRVPEADLRSGALDFAIGTFRQPPVESGLVSLMLYEARFVCIVRAGHPATRARLTVKRFAELGHVATFYPGLGPGLVDRLMAAQGYKRRVDVSLPHFLSVPFLVARSDLIATVPDVVARAMAPSLRLASITCPVRIPRLAVSLVWHARTDESPAHRWFRTLLAAVSQSPRVRGHKRAYANP